MGQVSGGKGFAQAKIIDPALMGAIERTLEEYAELKPIFARDLAFVRAASNTGLRISEIAHLRKEEILDDEVIVTRRKKKILVPRPVAVNPEGLAQIREWAKRVESGFIFPGKSAPCFIHHRPRFEVEECPDCEDRIAPLAMVKRKSDRISIFFRHLNTDHKRSADEVREWIDFASVEESDQFCPGGHMSIRAFAKRWQNLMKDLKIYQHGRGVHCVRHAAITRFYNDTRDIMATKEFAGHESIEMTKNYTHIQLVESIAKVKWTWPAAAARA